MCHSCCSSKATPAFSPATESFDAVLHVTLLTIRHTGKNEVLTCAMLILQRPYTLVFNAAAQHCVRKS